MRFSPVVLALMFIFGALAASVPSALTNEPNAMQSPSNPTGVDVRVVNATVAYTNFADESLYKMFSSNHPVSGFDRPAELFVIDAMVNISATLTITVDGDEPIAKDTPVTLLLQSGLISPEQGVTPSSITISSDAKEGVVTGVALESAPSVQGCQLSARVQRGVLLLGRLLLQGGAVLGTPDYLCVAYKCFIAVARDVQGVDGREATLGLAALAAELVLRAPPLVRASRGHTPPREPKSAPAPPATLLASVSSAGSEP